MGFFLIFAEFQEILAFSSIAQNIPERALLKS